MIFLWWWSLICLVFVHYRGLAINCSLIRYDCNSAHFFAACSVWSKTFYVFLAATLWILIVLYSVFSRNQQCPQVETSFLVHVGPKTIWRYQHWNWSCLPQNHLLIEAKGKVSRENKVDLPKELRHLVPSEMLSAQWVVDLHGCAQR